MILLKSFHSKNTTDLNNEEINFAILPLQEPVYKENIFKVEHSKNGIQGSLLDNNFLFLPKYFKEIYLGQIFSFLINIRLNEKVKEIYIVRIQVEMTTQHNRDRIKLLDEPQNKPQNKEISSSLGEPLILSHFNSLNYLLKHELNKSGPYILHVYVQYYSLIHRKEISIIKKYNFKVLKPLSFDVSFKPLWCGQCCSHKTNSMSNQKIKLFAKIIVNNLTTSNLTFSHLVMIFTNQDLEAVLLGSTHLGYDSNVRISIKPNTSYNLLFLIQSKGSLSNELDLESLKSEPVSARLMTKWSTDSLQQGRLLSQKFTSGNIFQDIQIPQVNISIFVPSSQGKPCRVGEEIDLLFTIENLLNETFENLEFKIDPNQGGKGQDVLISGTTFQIIDFLPANGSITLELKCFGLKPGFHEFNKISLFDRKISRQLYCLKPSLFFVI